LNYSTTKFQSKAFPYIKGALRISKNGEKIHFTCPRGKGIQKANIVQKAKSKKQKADSYFSELLAQLQTIISSKMHTQNG